jgi:hypothetical protein
MTSLNPERLAEYGLRAVSGLTIDASQAAAHLDRLRAALEGVGAALDAMPPGLRETVVSRLTITIRAAEDR